MPSKVSAKSSCPDFCGGVLGSKDGNTWVGERCALRHWVILSRRGDVSGSIGAEVRGAVGVGYHRVCASG